MVRYLKAARIFVVLLSVKAGVFMLLALFGLTPLPPILLGGLTVTWLLLALLIFWQVRRLEARFLQDEETASTAVPPRSTPKAPPTNRNRYGGSSPNDAPMTR